MDCGTVYDTIEAKTIPLAERIQAEFALTEEYRAVLEQKENIAKYKEEKAAFSQKYSCDDKLYDFCYNVFGELMNPGYLEEIIVDSTAKEDKRKAKRLLYEEILRELSVDTAGTNRYQSIEKGM